MLVSEAVGVAVEGEGEDDGAVQQPVEHGGGDGGVVEAVAPGVPVKVVQERLGHAPPSITLNSYAHVLPGMDRDAAKAVAALLV